MRVLSPFSVAVVLVASVLYALQTTPVPKADIIPLGDEQLRVPSDNSLLRLAKTLPGLKAPEGFAAAKNGAKTFLFTSTMTGAIVRLEVRKDRDPSESDLVVVARTGLTKDAAFCDASYEREPECGRPLGLCLDPQGHLVIVDTYHGIFRLRRTHMFASDPDEHAPLELIMSSAGHAFLNFATYVGDVLYFTDSSEHYQRRDVPLSFMDGRQSGRLFKLSNGTKTLLAQGIGFANGITSVDGGKTLLIAASFTARVHRFDVASLTLLDEQWHLPCLPDNLVYNDHHNVVMVGCAGVLQRTTEFLFAHPWLRAVLARLFGPVRVMQMAPKHGAVLLLDPHTGRVVQSWEDPGAQSGMAVVSEALECEGYVFFGSWQIQNSLSYIKSKDLPWKSK